MDGRIKRRWVTIAVAAMVLTVGAFASAAQVGADAWTSLVGGWAAEGGALVNSDGVNGNTQAYAEVAQSGETVIYTWTVDFRNTTFSLGPAAGMHIMSDDATHAQRGNSYLVFQDSDFIRIYKAAGALTKVADLPVTAAVGDKHTYRVEFNTASGLMQVYRNDVLAGEWRDSLPLKSGQYISVRTNGSIAAFTDVSVESK